MNEYQKEKLNHTRERINYWKSQYDSKVVKKCRPHDMGLPRGGITKCWLIIGHFFNSFHNYHWSQHFEILYKTEVKDPTLQV